MKKNSLLAIALSVIFFAGICITGISAYFISVAEAENEVNIGNNQVSIEETFENPDIKPNKTTYIKKKVEIANTGKTPAAIRVKAEFSKDDVFKYTTVDYNNDDWEKAGDYWYYKEPILPEQQTTPLFTKLTLKNPTAEQLSDFDVYVYAESRNCEKDSSTAEMKALFE